MKTKIDLLINNIEKAIIGKRHIIAKIVTALLCGGHVLVEDVPGVGKTQMVSALANSLGGKFNRIQMTPDIMPSDILGFSMPNPETGKFEHRHGAAMCNFLLADEINRASPKVQSSLLEVMEENQISIEGKTYELPKPFMTLATQNPIETFGTYHLPEAQMDRFLLKISIGYPSRADELLILSRNENNGSATNLNAVLGLEEIVHMQEAVTKVQVHPSVREYILSIITATRENENIKLGASPRGSIGLQKAARAFAFIGGCDYVTLDDVREMAVSVLSHRIMLSQKGKCIYKSQEDFILDLLNQIPVPIID